MKSRTNVIWQRQKAALLGLAARGTAEAGSAQANALTPPYACSFQCQDPEEFSPRRWGRVGRIVEGSHGVGCKCPPTFPGWFRALQPSGGSPGPHPARGLLLLFQGNNKFQFFLSFPPKRQAKGNHDSEQFIIQLNLKGI